MKLQEILDRFEAGQFSDELVAEFRKALRRVHGAFLKTQHCYLAAYSMPMPTDSPWEKRSKLPSFSTA